MHHTLATDEGGHLRVMKLVKQNSAGKRGDKADERYFQTLNMM